MVFGRAEWRLIRQKPTDEELMPYEKKLFESLFDDGESVMMSDLKNKFFDDLKKVQELLYKDCVTQKWFGRRPDQVRNTYVGIGVLVLFVGAGVTVLLAAKTHLGLLGIPVVLTGILVLATHSRMPARTAKGAATLARIRGFRRFIETAQADRLRFAEEENIFAKYLPYAIVFGATRKWAKAFADLGQEPQAAGMNWYSSPHSFDACQFARTIDSFSTRTSRTIVSTPSSSGRSGFGGGGSSGGGGGGGGGGSW